MESMENKVLRAPSALRRPLSEEEIVVPLDIILYLAGFMRFEDYRNFVRSFWPANDECDVVRNKLWQLSTHEITVTFLNEKRLKIEYNFDASRTNGHRILFNVETLLPVLGGVVPPGTEKFLGPSRLQNFMRTHVHLNMCTEGQYAACLCHQLKGGSCTGLRIGKPPAEVACRYGHFHHYCSQHVSNWLDLYVTPHVLLLEMPNLFHEEIAASLLLFMRNTVYLDRR